VFAAAALEGFWKFLGLDEQETQETQRPNAIAAYTRAQAIEDGVLVDVSETARAIELTLPVAVTAAVWSFIEMLALFRDDMNARLLEMLSMAQWLVSVTPGDVETLYFTTCFTAHLPHKIEKHALFKMVIEPGEHRELVITIMLPDEDVNYVPKTSNH